MPHCRHPSRQLGTIVSGRCQGILAEQLKSGTVGLGQQTDGASSQSVPPQEDTVDVSSQAVCLLIWTDVVIPLCGGWETTWLERNSVLGEKVSGDMFSSLRQIGLLNSWVANYFIHRLRAGACAATWRGAIRRVISPSNNLCWNEGFGDWDNRRLSFCVIVISARGKLYRDTRAAGNYEYENLFNESNPVLFTGTQWRSSAKSQMTSCHDDTDTGWAEVRGRATS